MPLIATFGAGSKGGFGRGGKVVYDVDYLVLPEEVAAGRAGNGAGGFRTSTDSSTIELGQVTIQLQLVQVQDLFQEITVAQEEEFNFQV